MNRIGDSCSTRFNVFSPMLGGRFQRPTKFDYGEKPLTNIILLTTVIVNKIATRKYSRRDFKFMRFRNKPNKQHWSFRAER